MLLAGEARRLYATYSVGEIADILGAPLPTVQAALRDYGVLTADNAAALWRQGWTAGQIGREWGMTARQVAGMLRREGT